MQLLIFPHKEWCYSLVVKQNDLKECFVVWFFFYLFFLESEVYCQVDKLSFSFLPNHHLIFPRTDIQVLF